jgi:hypothetical protein
LFYIYRSEKALGPSLVRLGSGFRGGWSATTRDSNAPLPCFRQGERPVGQWLWSVVPGVGLRVGEACGPRRERKCVLKEKEKKPKETIFLSSHAACPGEEERGTVSFKTTPFRFFFFFLYMKRRRFKKNASFHLSPARRQNA